MKDRKKNVIGLKALCYINFPQHHINYYFIRAVLNLFFYKHGQGIREWSRLNEVTYIRDSLSMIHIDIYLINE